jgi:Ca2+-binding RTX toxin-like protein
MVDNGANDTLDYSYYDQAVTVNLADGIAPGINDGEETGISSIENITGSAFDDTLIGDDGSNIIKGGSGDDTIDGRAGDDILEGGDGNDDLQVMWQVFCIMERSAEELRKKKW